MSKLEKVIDPAKDTLRLIPGYAAEGGRISIGGQEQSALWLGDVSAVPGDSLMILINDRSDAPSFAMVIGLIGDAGMPSPDEGVVSLTPVKSDTVEVTTDSGTVEARFLASYTPSVSDRVCLLWQGGSPTILGKVGAAPPPVKRESEPGAGPSAPPSRDTDGDATFSAVDSGTWSTGTESWNRYLGKDVYQGYYPSQGNNRGAWFYGGKPTKLRSKKISKVEMWFPRRMNAGNWRSAVSAKLYLHTSKQKPRGDVRRTSGTTVTIPSKWKGGWVELPSSWGNSITKGSGVGLSGGTYAGFAGMAGKNKDTRSGQLRISWKA